jgi:hypothetical protein
VKTLEENVSVTFDLVNLLPESASRLSKITRVKPCSVRDQYLLTILGCSDWVETLGNIQTHVNVNSLAGSGA